MTVSTVGCQGSGAPVDAGPDAAMVDARRADDAGDAGGGGTRIGPAGGTVTSTDGRLVVTIPAGALAADQTFVVSAYDANVTEPGYAGTVRAYQVSPGGLTLRAAATVRLNGSALGQLWTTAAGEPDDTRHWVPLTNIRRGADWIEGETTHFSGERHVPLLCGTDNECPTNKHCYLSNAPGVPQGLGECLCDPGVAGCVN